MSATQGALLDRRQTIVSASGLLNLITCSPKGVFTHSSFSSSDSQNHAFYLNEDKENNCSSQGCYSGGKFGALPNLSSLSANSDANSVGQAAVSFRYQLRRPVETWKYVEGKKEDGSLHFLCRVCSAVYKHKKSLNKHWKDKHADGAVIDDGENDEDECDDCNESDSLQPEVLFTTQEESSKNCLKSNFDPKDVHSPKTCQPQRLSLPFTRPLKPLNMRTSLRRNRELGRIQPQPISIAVKRSHFDDQESFIANTINVIKPQIKCHEKNLPKRRNSDLHLKPESPHEQCPMDLSVNKSVTQNININTTVESKNKTNSSITDPNLLTLLLTTALSALSNEPKPQISSNTANLLRAVGSILISSVDCPTNDASHESSNVIDPIPISLESSKIIENKQPAQTMTPILQNMSFTTNYSPNTADLPENMALNYLDLCRQPLFPEQQQQQLLAITDAAIPCPRCKFIARWFSELRAHMVNHSEHRMFGCCYCPYRAKWKWDVAKHMRRCPYARHVSHLQNECLLRMVCYFSPPQEDILFAYFPKSDFPGVGIDKPISPPHSLSKPSSVFSASSSSAESTELTSSAKQQQPLEAEKKPLTSPPIQVTEQTDDEDDENKPLYIDEEVHINVEIISPKSESKNTIKMSTSETDKQSIKMSEDVPHCLTTTPNHHLEKQKQSLIFKLKRCSQCDFHSVDEKELDEHWNITHS